MNFIFRKKMFFHCPATIGCVDVVVPFLLDIEGRFSTPLPWATTKKPWEHAAVLGDLRSSSSLS